MTAYHFNIPYQIEERTTLQDSPQENVNSHNQSQESTSVPNQSEQEQSSPITCYDCFVFLKNAETNEEQVFVTSASTKRRALAKIATYLPKVLLDIYQEKNISYCPNSSQFTSSELCLAVDITQYAQQAHSTKAYQQIERARVASKGSLNVAEWAAFFVKEPIAPSKDQKIQLEVWRQRLQNVNLQTGLQNLLKICHGQEELIRKYPTLNRCQFLLNERPLLTATAIEQHIVELKQRLAKDGLIRPEVALDYFKEQLEFVKEIFSARTQQDLKKLDDEMEFFLNNYKEDSPFKVFCKEWVRSAWSCLIECLYDYDKQTPRGSSRLRPTCSSS